MLSSEHVKNQGLEVWIDGDKLKVAPPEKVTPEVAAFIKTHKQKIMSELKSYPKGTPEGLMQDMEATWEEVFESVKTAYESKQRQFKATPHIFILEQRIGALQQAVLKSEASLEDFELTAHEWERTANSELN